MNCFRFFKTNLFMLNFFKITTSLPFSLELLQYKIEGMVKEMVRNTKLFDKLKKKSNFPPALVYFLVFGFTSHLVVMTFNWALWNFLSGLFGLASLCPQLLPTLCCKIQVLAREAWYDNITHYWKCLMAPANYKTKYSIFSIPFKVLYH